MRTNILLGIVAFGGSAIAAATSGNNKLRYYAIAITCASLGILTIKQWAKFINLCIEEDEADRKKKELDEQISALTASLQEKAKELQKALERTESFLQRAREGERQASIFASELSPIVENNTTM